MADRLGCRSVGTSRRGLILGCAGAGILAAGLSRGAHAAEAAAPLDVTRYVYAGSAAAPEVFLINTETNAVENRVPLGLIAEQMLVNRGDGVVIAGGRASPVLALAGAFGGNLRSVALPEPVARITGSSDGTAVAVLGSSGRVVSIVDIDAGAVRATIRGLPRVRDIMFDAQNSSLYVAADGLEGVGVLDIAAGRLSNTLAGGATGFSALARSADGRRILALAEAGGPIDVFDAQANTALGQLADGQGASGIYPSSIAGLLLVPNDSKATLAVYRPGQLEQAAVLPGARGVTGVYATWLDSVALMPSQAGRSVLAYDLDRVRQLPDIEVGGNPGKGVVSADTGTLYLPMQGQKRIVAIDGATQRVKRSIDLPADVQVVATAGGGGLCH